MSPQFLPSHHVDPQQEGIVYLPESSPLNGLRARLCAAGGAEVGSGLQCRRKPCPLTLQVGATAHAQQRRKVRKGGGAQRQCTPPSSSLPMPLYPDACPPDIWSAPVQMGCMRLCGCMCGGLRVGSRGVKGVLPASVQVCWGVGSRDAVAVKAKKRPAAAANARENNPAPAVGAAEAQLRPTHVERRGCPPVFTRFCSLNPRAGMS